MDGGWNLGKYAGTGQSFRSRQDTGIGRVHKDGQAASETADGVSSEARKAPIASAGIAGA